MPPEDPTSQGVQPSSDDVQRKLWFEYLTKLNDRELQSSRASGFTPWVLLAVAAAIVYKCVPQIPTFLSISGAAAAALVILLLEVDVLIGSGVFVLILVSSCAPGAPSRLVPEQSRRTTQLGVFVGRTLLVAVIVGHFAAPAFVAGVPFVRDVLVVFGSLWLWQLLAGIWRTFVIAREAKKHKVPVPEFSLSQTTTKMPLAAAIALVFMLVTVPPVTLFLFLRYLGNVGVPWVIPLGAATDVLALIVVLLVLLYMGVSSLSRGIYLALESDVVLERLSPSEIRAIRLRINKGT